MFEKNPTCISFAIVVNNEDIGADVDTIKSLESLKTILEGETNACLFKYFSIIVDSTSTITEDLKNYNVVFYVMTPRVLNNWRTEFDRMMTVHKMVDNKNHFQILFLDFSFFRAEWVEDAKKQEMEKYLQENKLENSVHSLDLSNHVALKTEIKEVTDCEVDYEFCEDTISLLESRKKKKKYGPRNEYEIVYEKVKASGILNFFIVIHDLMDEQNQKRIVVSNYVNYVTSTDILDLGKILKSLYNVRFLDEKRLSNLRSCIDRLIGEKLIAFIAANKDNPNGFEYFNKLKTLQNMFSKYRIITSIDFEIKNLEYSIESELKNLTEITNLEKLISILDLISPDTDNIEEIFSKLKENNKIIENNYNNSGLWTTFIDKCVSKNIKSNHITAIIEKIIIKRIEQYCNSGSETLYPYALETVLTENIRFFCAKKLMMFLNKYIRNVNSVNATSIISLQKEDFNKIVQMENRLFNLLDKGGYDY